jgi:hypothetical protein
MPAIGQAYHKLSAYRRGTTAPSGIFRSMLSPKPVRLCMAALLPLLAVLALGVNAARWTAEASAAKTETSKHALLTSAQLWATIDVCNPPDQPDTVGIRGSMPGDGQAGQMMFMRFRLQYMASSKHWVDLTTEAGSGWVAVGRAKATRQAGRSFQLVPVPGKPAFMLRGVVSFQWRRGATVVTSASRPTTAGRQSLAGADPAGYSSASCSIG